MVVNNVNAFLLNDSFKRVIVAIGHDKGYNVSRFLQSFVVSS